MTTTYAILAVLRQGPLHGYAVRRSLQERLGLLWPVNQGQIYSTLGRLTTQGAIEIRPGPESGGASRAPERSFALTASGAHLCARWLAAPTASEPNEGELAAKLTLAVESLAPAKLAQLLEQQQALCRALLTTYRTHLEATRPRRGSRRALAFAAGAALLEADLEWLAELERCVVGSGVRGVTGNAGPRESQG